jgi:hypothetical protein
MPEINMVGLTKYTFDELSESCQAELRLVVEGLALANPDWLGMQITIEYMDAEKAYLTCKVAMPSVE